MKEKPAPKRGRGRPQKGGHGRKEVGVFLPIDLLAELDHYVHDLREEAPAMNKTRTRAYGKAEEAGA